MFRQEDAKSFDELDYLIQNLISPNLPDITYKCPLAIFPEENIQQGKQDREDF